MVSSLSLSSTLGDSWGLWIGALATAVLFVVLYYRPLRALRRVRGRAPASNGKAGGGGPGSRGGCEDAIFPYGVTELRGRRPYMEDRHAVAGRSATGHPDISLFCVFDGHGGAGASQFCKDTLTRNVVGSVGFPNAPKQALSNGFLRTDDDYLQIAQTNGREDGTTAICLMCHGDRLTCANAGDSRAVLVKRSGAAVPLSRDHKPNAKDEQARISRKGGSVVFWGVWRVEGILAVSRAIGDRMLKQFVIAEPEFREHKRTAEDAFVVLASDGLWDVLSNEEVAEIANSIGDAEEASKVLAETAVSRESTDNICVLCVDIRNPPETGGMQASNGVNGVGTPSISSSSSKTA